MQLYEISESEVHETIYAPDSILLGLDGRRIAQKRLNSHLLRVVFEEINGEIIVVTTYKARAKRYEI